MRREKRGGADDRLEKGGGLRISGAALDRKKKCKGTDKKTSPREQWNVKKSKGGT